LQVVKTSSASKLLTNASELVGFTVSNAIDLMFGYIYLHDFTAHASVCGKRLSFLALTAFNCMPAAGLLAVNTADCIQAALKVNCLH
jgi:hypothetical protein